MAKPADETRRRLLDAAERKLADEGIEGASFVGITESAGHRSQSAIQHHFGDRTGLLEAITRRRVEWLAERRAELLERLPDDPSATDLVRVVVEPLAQLLDDPGGSAYLRVQADMLGNPRRLENPLLANPWARPGLVEVNDRLSALLPPHATAPGDRRHDLVTTLVLHSLADRARAVRAGTDHGEFVDALVAAAVAILEMPAE